MYQRKHRISIKIVIGSSDLKVDQPEKKPDISTSVYHLNVNITFDILISMAGHLSMGLSESASLGWYNSFIVFMLWNESYFNELGKPHWWNSRSGLTAILSRIYCLLYHMDCTLCNSINPFLMPFCYTQTAIELKCTPCFWRFLVTFNCFPNCRRTNPLK